MTANVDVNRGLATLTATLSNETLGASAGPEPKSVSNETPGSSAVPETTSVALLLTVFVGAGFGLRKKLCGVSPAIES